MIWLLFVLKALLAADFISGFYHWIEQRYFGEQWPLIGKWIQKPNASHHQDPAAFLHQSYWARNWVSMVVSGAILAVAYLLFNPPGWILLAVLIASQANETHAWAHYRAKCRVVRGLQEFGMLQSPRHHAGHHVAPYLTRYCVMTDWLNPILDGMGIWRLSEWIVAKTIGIKPHGSELQLSATKRSWSNLLEPFI